jgi:hypothetical protein
MILAATSDAADNGDFWLTQPVATILADGGAIIAAAIAFWVAALARRQTDRHWETANDD